MTIPEIWNQKTIPVVYCAPEDGAVIVRMPGAPCRAGDGVWLAASAESTRWDVRARSWTVDRAAFTEILQRLLARFSQAYVLQAHVMAPEALHLYGGGSRCVVTATEAVRWRERELRWSLLRLV